MAAIELYSTSLFSDANLQSYWRMEGNSNDAKGSNNGSDASVTFSTGNGKFNQGGGYNGSTSLTTITSASNIDFNYNVNFSISLWFADGGGNANGDCLIIKWDTVVSRYAYAIRFSNNHILFSRYDGTNNPSIEGGTDITSGAYFHCVCVKSGSSMLIYINGASDAVAITDTTTTTTTNSSALYFGSRNGAAIWAGKLDDIAIFNRVLTPTEISNLYAGTFPTGAAWEMMMTGVGR